MQIDFAIRDVEYLGAGSRGIIRIGLFPLATDLSQI